MNTISLGLAQCIIDAALAGERSAPERRIAVAVCDTGAHPVALAHIAQAKAFTCVAYGKPTNLVRDWAEESPVWFQGVTNVAQEKMGMPMIGCKGGVIIQDDAGNILGAVGVAGVAGEQDEALACLGIESVGLIAAAN